MKISSFESKGTKSTVLCLGWFDSVHVGHRSIIESAKQLCLKLNANLAVLTFVNDETFSINKNARLVYDFEERISILKNQGVNEVICSVFNSDFAKKTPLDFLSEICDNRPIAAFVCGSDYTFGKDGLGNITLLKNFCEQRNIQLKVCSFKTDLNGAKVSTGEIKRLLVEGKIELANELLGDDFFFCGTVVKGRMQGRTIGFPTANVILSQSKINFKRGVYASYVIIDGKKYKAITNIGTAPTFHYDKEIAECHILDFCGDLYGKKLTVYLKKYVRDVKKFDSVNSLKEQLQKDIEVIK